MRLLASLASGSLAGLIATGPMSAVMLALDRWLPGRDPTPLPPEQITEGVMERAVNVNLPEEDIERLTVASHFGYGASTGALFGLLAKAVPLPRLLSGVIFGLMVWTLSYLGWVPAAGIMPPASEQPARRNVTMIAAHVAWGATMGLALRALERRSGR